MKIIDKTPFRQPDGSIQFVDRVKASLKYGLPWYDRIQAQDKIVPMLEKHLGRSFILLRNVTLAGTDIELPIILIGPPAVLVVNVITEKGIFRAQEDEWGKITGNQSVPAKINHLIRTQRMGKVLQVFLNKAGVSGVTVESLLLSANPGTHVESVRPIVRVVMSDALDRFAASLSQTKGSLEPEICAGIAQVILTGSTDGKPAEMQESESAPEEKTAAPQENQFFFQDDSEEKAKPSEQAAPAQSEPKKPARKKKIRILGLTLAQIGILAGILLLWLCIIIAFIAYATAQLNV